MRFDVATHVEGERVVLGHEWGEKLRRDLLAEVRTLSDGDTVEVSFGGVEIVSTLTISAFLVSMLDARRDGRPHVGIVVTDANEDQRDVIVKCLEFSSTSTSPLLVACRTDDGELTLLGKVDPTTRRTWDTVLALAASGSPGAAGTRKAPRAGGAGEGPRGAGAGKPPAEPAGGKRGGPGDGGTFRAADLAAALGITPQLANNRLARLTRVGALVRSPTTASTGVREFVYRLPVPASAERRRRRHPSRAAGASTPRRRPRTRSTS